MTQCTLNVPDNNIEFFMTLIKEFKYELMHNVDNSINYINEANKCLVRNRITNSSNLLNWAGEKDEFDVIQS